MSYKLLYGWKQHGSAIHCSAERPHTKFSVELAEKLRHYSRHSITQKQIVSVVSRKSNMHDANWQWDQIVCSSYLTTPISHAQTHIITLQCNQTKLCDYRQKMYFPVSCQTVEWYKEQRVERVGCMLGSLNQAVLKLAGRLYINIIHQAAFTDMTSVVGHNTYIKHLLFSVKRIKGEHFPMKGCAFESRMPWVIIWVKYLEKEYHSPLKRGYWNQDIPLWSSDTLPHSYLIY